MAKAQAIELLRLHSPSQILVHFPSKWWGNNDMTFTWTDEEMDSVDFQMGPKKNGRSWVTAIMSYYVYPSYKNCLAVYNGGEMVQEMEQMDETVWLEGLHYLNQKFLARAFPNICKPTKIARFKWYSNLHFGGVIATETLESKLRGIGFKTMAEPLLDKDGGIRVLFAGEVTNDSSHAFVNAAVYTGFREADRIINFYKK
ncbi:protein anon-37Cs-like [Photinus pyralis]|uniref:protein anon-37Cs-like n=1 Tax=Photinus pyralis TaxID=7054 RepID=UPI0012674E7E|nr:protein anon-37Cs-like [Photinus pyralis]